MVFLNQSWQLIQLKQDIHSVSMIIHNIHVHLNVSYTFDHFYCLTIIDNLCMSNIMQLATLCRSTWSTWSSTRNWVHWRFHYNWMDQTSSWWWISYHRICYWKETYQWREVDQGTACTYSWSHMQVCILKNLVNQTLMRSA